MKKILVTGGAGFIGSNLCRKLLDRGDFIICLDNFSTGKFFNIEPLLINSRFKLLEQDVENLVGEDVDEIYNLACPASPPHYQANPVKTIKTSVLGVMNLLELAKKCNAKFLQASTSEVYGNPIEHPQSETYWGNVNPIGIRSCYDEGKRCAETLIMDYNRQFNTNVKIVRIFNTYGPYMDVSDGRVVSNFIIQALKNVDLTIYGNGLQTRSFCYVDDLVDGLITMMDKKDFTGPVNLGNPSERTISDFANLIIKKTNSKSKIIHQDLPADDPIKRKPDITLAQNVLGWNPVVDIDKGLDLTIEYFKTRI